MDDIAALLDRAVTAQVSSSLRPPVATIEAAARRRDVRRSLVSLAVVLLLVVGSVIGMASTGHASEPVPAASSVASALSAPPGSR
jgi:hypothetical protein